MSYSASTIGLPVLRHSSSASIAVFWRIFSARRKSTRPRSCAVVVAHGPSSKAALAAATARFTSSALASGTCAITSSRGGIVDGKGLVGLAVDPFAVDVHLISAYVGFHSAGHEASCVSIYCRAVARLRGRCRPRPHVLALRPPYTKKKNAARPMKNSVPPNIHISYDHSELICCAGKNTSTIPSVVVTSPLMPASINVVLL